MTVRTKGMTTGALLLGLLWLAPAAAQPPAVPPTHERGAAEAGPEAAPRPDDATAPRPAIWLLADDDTRIYLFGTVHILPPGLVWRSAALDRIVAEADELVMETAEDPNDADPAALEPFMMLGKPTPILWQVAPHRRKALREMIESVGLIPELFDGMQAWAAAMTIAVTGLSDAYGGADGPVDELTGVEDALQADFAAAGRPISGVETGEQQLGFLAGMTLRDQRAMLEAMIDAYLDGTVTDPGALGDEGWLNGDVEAIGEEMAQMPPELFDVLLTRRNRTWTGWLIDRLDRPGTVLFAVGAGHLAGRDSVQSMLAEHGLTVTRHD